MGVVRLELQSDPLAGATAIGDGVRATFSIGEVGPVGPPGPAGSDLATYQHTQVAAAASWLINHNLGYEPNVSASDDTGAPVVGAVTHHSTNQLEIQFNSPIAGVARLT